MMSEQETPPAYAPDEPQSETAMAERNALSEREDGTNRRGPEGPSIDTDSGVPTLTLPADQQQDVDPDAEARALSEREDGTNRGR
jgi:hypothetical protein